MAETYISVDIEADGPIPGAYSMLAIGAVAMSSTGELLSRFYRNLERLPGAREHYDTMEWWKRHQDAYEYTRSNQIDPGTAMKEFDSWVRGYPKPVFLGYPATYDFMFTYWYLIRFVGSSPFGFSGLDIKSYAMARLANQSFKGTSKRTMPVEWFSHTGKHTHRADDDALEQARLFFAMKVKY